LGNISNLKKLIMPLSNDKENVRLTENEISAVNYGNTSGGK
jgi:hypothetical protein